MRRSYIYLNLAALIVLVWVSLNTGITKLHNIIALLMGSGNPSEVSIAQEIRGPRVLAAVLVGATLGIGGALSQGTLRNPLAEPVLLGTTGGAALFTLVGILIFKLTIGTPLAILFGIIGALIATLFTYQIGRNGRDGFAFVIMGIAVSATLISLVGITTVMINKPEARGVTFWSLGTLSMATKNQVLFLLPILLITWVASYLLAPKLDYLAIGDLRARHLGVDVSKVRLLAFLIISISVGAITSVFGQISFLALAIPHVIRALIGVRHRILVLHSAIFGAALLVLADLSSRTLASPNELPIGLMTALIGAPILIIAVRNWMATRA